MHEGLPSIKGLSPELFVELTLALHLISNRANSGSLLSRANKIQINILLVLLYHIKYD